MKDKEFLAALHLLLEKYAPNLEQYNLPRLKAVITATPEDQDSSGGTEPSIEDRIDAFKMRYPASAKDLVDILYAMNKRLDEK